jgi:hypothetical protein
MTEARKLSRNETHDLSMIVKDRTRVLKAHVEQQKTMMLADFEKQMAAYYSFNQDATWKTAMEKAQAVVSECQAEVAKRCEEIGIPATFAPSIQLYWSGRGENAVKDRQAELRRVAKASAEAMAADAIVKIEREGLDLRTQIVAMGLLSDAAQTFLQTLKPVEDTMQRLDFADVEKKLQIEHADRRKQFGVSRFDA